MKTNLEHKIINFQEFKNKQLGNDLDKILDNLDSEGLDELNIVKDIMLNDSHELELIIMVQDNSYFYGDCWLERNQDYSLLLNIINEK